MSHEEFWESVANGSIQITDIVKEEKLQNGNTAITVEALVVNPINYVTINSKLSVKE